jgi:hypothetical protein
VGEMVEVSSSTARRSQGTGVGRGRGVRVLDVLRVTWSPRAAGVHGRMGAFGYQARAGEVSRRERGCREV